MSPPQYWPRFLCLGGGAYADTVDNPGDVTIKFANTDSHVYVNGKTIYVNTTHSAFLYGPVASDGTMFFDQSDISFEAGTTGGYTVRLVAISDATGNFCPNSGKADITFSARLEVTGSGANCRVALGTITLTTGTSGAVTGSPFGSIEPVLVSSSTFANSNGPVCGTSNTAVDSYFGLPQTGTVTLGGALMTPGFGGTGC